jgi:restriction system protein
MSLPSYEDCMFPFLQALADGTEVHLHQLLESIANKLHVTEAERAEMLPSGRIPTFSSRVAWAKTYLKMAGLITQPSRGRIMITSIGKSVLSKKPERIDRKYLQQFPSFREFIKRKSDKQPAASKEIEASGDASLTPQELMEQGYSTLRASLQEELLERIRNLSSDAFERLVVELMVQIGYGGSFDDAARAVGGSGDGGIDGIIQEDLLGLDSIYLQAKKYRANNPVPGEEIRTFIGSMDIKGARKGVFITCSSFRKKAKLDAEAANGKRIVLIDGDKLANLMIDYSLGVTEVQAYRVQRLDSDYFEEL